MKHYRDVKKCRKNGIKNHRGPLNNVRLESLPVCTSIHSIETRGTLPRHALHEESLRRDYNRGLVETEIQSYRGQDAFGRGLPLSSRGWVSRRGVKTTQEVKYSRLPFLKSAVVDCFFLRLCCFLSYISDENVHRPTLLSATCLIIILILVSLQCISIALSVFYRIQHCFKLNAHFLNAIYYT